MKSNDTGRPRKLRYPILAAIGVGMLYWFLEAAIDVLVFGEPRYLEQVFSPSAHEIWARCLSMCLIIGFGVHVHLTLKKSRRAAAALARLEQEKAIILDSMSELVVYQDREGTIIWANRAAAEAAGRPLDELTGRRCYKVWHGRTERLPDCPVVRAMKSGRPEEAEMTTPEGRVWQVRGYPVQDDGGNIVAAVEVVLEITERKRAEEALATSQREKAAILDSMSELVVYQDLEGRIIWANWAAAEAARLPLDELTGRRCYEVSHGRTERCHGCPVSRAIKTGRPEEAQMTTPEGRVCQVRGYPVQDDAGNLVAAVEVVLDITERKRAEQGLREAKEFSDSLIASMQDGVAILDSRGVHVDVNPAFCQMTGFSREELIGVGPPHPYWGPEEREQIDATFQKTRRGEFQDFELTFQRKNGERFPVIVSPSSIKDVQGNVLSYFATVKDITERKRAEEEHRQQEEAMHRAVRLESIGKLAGGIAHDFNNLMTGILGYSNILLSDLGDDDSRREDVEEIKGAAERAATLTRQLLAFSLKRMIEPKLLDLNVLVEGMSRMLKRLIGEDIKLVTALEPELGSVKADPVQIEEVIMNLLVNARDAMPQGGRLTIQTANVDLDEDYARARPAVVPGPYVMMTVTDTGVGMDEEIQERIFEPFFTTKKPGEGTGLGLATVYGIVRKHDGHVGVESKPGQGATFKVYLPRVAAEAEALAEKEETEAAPGGTEVILVVEDERTVRRLAHRVLKASGYTPLSVDSASEAQRVMAQHGQEVALLLTDVVLPDGNGPDLWKELAANHPSLKVLYMSGYADNNMVRDGTLAPGTPFLPKPFGPLELLREVRQALDK
ncbi:MAG: PAS domain S-box protein [Candidatus Brocadiae bacterium]|nr:PAS domain S-box protein [Candidatus Brocadiia bacterium]